MSVSKYEDMARELDQRAAAGHHGMRTVSRKSLREAAVLLREAAPEEVDAGTEHEDMARRLREVLSLGMPMRTWETLQDAAQLLEKAGKAAAETERADKAEEKAAEQEAARRHWQGAALDQLARKQDLERDLSNALRQLEKHKRTPKEAAEVAPLKRELREKRKLDAAVAAEVAPLKRELREAGEELMDLRHEYHATRAEAVHWLEVAGRQANRADGAQEWASQLGHMVRRYLTANPGGDQVDAEDALTGWLGMDHEDVVR